MGGRRIAVFLVVLSLVTGLVPVDPGALAQEAGSNLAQEVTATDPADGGTLAVENVGSFDANGGEAVFEPGTSAEERFTYQGLDTSANYLVGIVRQYPNAHPSGTFVGVIQGAEPSPSPSAESSPSASPTPEPSPTEAAPETSNGPTTSGDGSSTDPPLPVSSLIHRRLS